MTKTIEESLDRRVSGEERVKIAEWVSLNQRLEAKWNSDWAVSWKRRGKPVGWTATLHEGRYQEIESKQIRARISWVQGRAVEKV
jgi:hypothetical protein